MGIFGNLFKGQIDLSEQEIGFLVNYFGERKFEWGIHENVMDRFPNLGKNLEALMREGYLETHTGMYAITDKGKKIQRKFREKEKERKKEATEKMMEASLSSNHVRAYKERANYERESVIPHGIGMDWDDKDEAERLSSKYEEMAMGLDFSDCLNSEKFKQRLRDLYVGSRIAGTHPMRDDITAGFEDKVGEYLNCPELERELFEKCVWPNPPRLRIYLTTKVLEQTIKSICGEKGWKGKYRLGIYDCTSQYNMAMAEFEVYKSMEIDGFPKTFKTYWKHREENSEKFKNWMAQCPVLKLPK